MEFWVNEATLEGPRECGCGRREECVPEALSTPQIHTTPQSAFAAATSRPRSPNSCAPTGAPGPACNTAQGCRLQQAAAHWHLPPSDRNPVGHLRHFGHSPLSQRAQAPGSLQSHPQTGMASGEPALSLHTRCSSTEGPGALGSAVLFGLNSAALKAGPVPAETRTLLHCKPALVSHLSQATASITACGGHEETGQTVSQRTPLSSQQPRTRGCCWKTLTFTGDRTHTCSPRTESVQNPHNNNKIRKNVLGRAGRETGKDFRGSRDWLRSAGRHLREGEKARREELVPGGSSLGHSLWDKAALVQLKTVSEEKRKLGTRKVDRGDQRRAESSLRKGRGAEERTRSYRGQWAFQKEQS